ncbi:fimbrial protein [Photorhabdus caribbeanensis]|uniref:fimbrial protein n=1 Tax=Photorhabdus caribbeanensis TaxID=1004165 RepID=UPI001BD524DB|nr:fimbrial protein [Photorhabdus caribbeanensis]MBS9422370.1 hypothetical protein [Photorhabdus caribbeanensis]
MKKQMMKTSVLAAVLLSMGMGMAHAASGDVLANSSVVVNAKVGAVSCEMSLSNDILDLGMATDADFAGKAGKLVKQQPLTVSLKKCDGIIDSKTKRSTTAAKLVVRGTTIHGENTYFGNLGPDAKAGDVAVGLEDTKVTGTLLQNETEFDFASDSNLADIKKEFNVGLVVKDPNQVNAGNISVPLTFQLIQK